MYVKGKRVPTNFQEKVLSGEKIHTVRWDAKNRWRPGMKIHFATGVRTNNYNCFKEGVCTAVQSIEIKERDVYIDGVRLNWDELEEFAKNDGFDDLEGFWAWFDSYSPFTGKIIHWTNKRY